MESVKGRYGREGSVKYRVIGIPLDAILEDIRSIERDTDGLLDEIMK